MKKLRKTLPTMWLLYFSLLVLVYFPSLMSFFLPVDDPLNLQQANAVLGGSSPFSLLHGRRFRPLVLLYHTALYFIFGLHPMAHRLAMFFLMAAVATLSALYASRFFSPKSPLPWIFGLFVLFLYSHYELAVWLAAGQEANLAALFILLPLVLLDFVLSLKAPSWVLAFVVVLGFLVHEVEVVVPLLLIASYATFPGEKKKSILPWLFGGLAVSFFFALFVLHRVSFSIPLYGAKTLFAFFVPIGEFVANIFGQSLLYPPYRSAIAHSLWHPWLLGLGGAAFVVLLLLAYFGREAKVRKAPALFGLVLYAATFSVYVLPYGEGYSFALRHFFVPSLGLLLLFLTPFEPILQKAKTAQLASLFFGLVLAANILRILLVQPFYVRPAFGLQHLVQTAVACCQKGSSRLTLFTPFQDQDEDIAPGIQALLGLYGYHISQLDILPYNATIRGLKTCQAPPRQLFCWPASWRPRY